MINIGNRREVFWDDFLINKKKTDAPCVLHESTRREPVLLHDDPWEGDMCDYYNLFRDKNGVYRMYYLGWSLKDIGDKIRVCYAESKDGIHWEKPVLHLRKWQGSDENNIILSGEDGTYDNFMVMRDPNEKEGSPELYKALASHNDGGVAVLWCYTSPDAIRFTKGWEVTRSGKFDTLNTVLWDKYTRKYYAYVRGFHKRPGEEGQREDLCRDIRDIRVLTSEDFRTWTEPQQLSFAGGPDYPLYTNVISKYPRADHMFIGFPTRYVERPDWNACFDRLCGKEARQERMKLSPRYGLAVTDCVFMSSRDGYSFDRTDEAFMRPGPEDPLNWVYGDCYPSLGLVATPGSLPDTEDELSFFCSTGHWSGTPKKLWRYTVRMDGFRSRRGNFKGQNVVTKPFSFKGSTLRINFSTSAAGSVYITLKGRGGKVLSSGELFGDSVDRIVDFDGSLKELSGKQVVMEILLKDADIYSFKFE